MCFYYFLEMLYIITFIFSSLKKLAADKLISAANRLPLLLKDFTGTKTGMPVKFLAVIF